MVAVAGLYLQIGGKNTFSHLSAPISISHGIFKWLSLEWITV